MSERIWSVDELTRFARFEDAEVRHWAIDRLIRHFPSECGDAIAPHLIDDHEATPTIVARHLGRYGGSDHFSVLIRGLRLLPGAAAGHCLDALTRLGYTGVIDLATNTLGRHDLSEVAAGIVVEAMADLGSEESRDVVRQFAADRPELLAEPAVLRGVLRVATVDEIPGIVMRFLGAMQWRGAPRAGDAFRTLMDSLQIDDAGWCFRTGPSGRIELRKTIKAVEAGYDCDILDNIGEATVERISKSFHGGRFDEIVRSVSEWIVSAVEQIGREPDDDLPERTAVAAAALASPEALAELERLGHPMQQWVVSFQLSAAFRIARYRNIGRELERARGDLDRLLQLAELETAFLLPDLPAAIAVVCQDDENSAGRAQDWCLRMLEAQGPFFPKVVALETLGELRAVHFIPEVIEYLADENSYVYGAAERALSKMGEALIGPARRRMESGAMDPEAAHSLLILLCDLGTRAAYEAVIMNLDWFMEEVQPGSTAEWVSLFGTEELIDPLRDWLDEDPAMVGQGLLLLGAINNVRIPEEDEILQAIEEERARQAGEGDDASGGSEREGGDYVM
jgi:HEAT repeat protein